MYCDSGHTYKTRTLIVCVGIYICHMCVCVCVCVYIHINIYIYISFVFCLLFLGLVFTLPRDSCTFLLSSISQSVVVPCCGRRQEWRRISNITIYVYSLGLLRHSLKRHVQLCLIYDLYVRG